MFRWLADRHRLELILAAACWGAGTAISKQAVAEIPPFTLLFTQLAISVGFLSLIRRLGRRPEDEGRASRRLGRLGLLNPGIAYGLSLLGLTTISASQSVLLWAAEPILILGLGGLLLHERLGATLIALSGIAIGGLTLVVGASGSLSSAAVLGAGLTLLGVVCCAIYSIAARSWLRESAATLPVVLSQQMHALAVAGVSVLATSVLGIAALPREANIGAVVSAIGSGVLYYGAAYWFYLSALREIPASIAAASFYLVPVFGLAAAAIYGERLDPVQWLGAAIVVSAVAIIAVKWTTAPVPVPSLSLAPADDRTG